MMSLTSGFSCRPLRAAACAGLLLPGLATADAGISVRETQALQFPTVPGEAYLLEGSMDGTAWVTVAGPIFGDGGPCTRFLREGEVDWAHYRVSQTDPAEGLAPVTLAHTTVLLNDRGRARQVIFLNETDGLLKTDLLRARTFAWALRKTGPDSAVADLTFKNGDTACLALAFTAGSGGTSQYRCADAAGTVLDTEAGGFSVQPGRVRMGTGGAALLPDLSGHTVVLADASGATTMAFGEAGQVEIRRKNGTPVLQPYTWEVDTPVAGSLDVTATGGLITRYRLDQSFRGGGTFTRQRFSDAGGIFVPLDPAPVDGGGFNIPTDPDAPVNPDCPPRGIGGLSLYLSGSDPVLLTFDEDGSGTAAREREGSVEVTSFEYHYDRSGGNGATVTLTFPGAAGDKVEDYDFDFTDDCAGSYSRSCYENGQSTVAENGSFTPGGAAFGN